MFVCVKNEKGTASKGQRGRAVKGKGCAGIAGKAARRLRRAGDEAEAAGRSEHVGPRGGVTAAPFHLPEWAAGK